MLKGNLLHPAAAILSSLCAGFGAAFCLASSASAFNTLTAQPFILALLALLFSAVIYALAFRYIKKLLATGLKLYIFAHGFSILFLYISFFFLFSTSTKGEPLYKALYPIICTLLFLTVAVTMASVLLLASSESRKTFYLVAFVAGFPFVYLFPYVLPLNGRYISMGNDFRILYYSYKVYLLDFLSRMQIPLWSPSESAGFPFYSSPFAQAFYPLNVLLAIYYRIAGGYTEFDHHRFTVLGISIFSVGLFLWLRQIKGLNLRAVLFGTLVMGVSFKVTEILRFPNAVHTAAWIPWILYAITRIFQSESSREARRYGWLLFASLVCLLTGGYPYYAFYSIFLFIPYLALFFVPAIRKSVFAVEAINFKRTFSALMIVGSAALVICAPYFFKMASLLQQTTDRGGDNYAYSTAEAFNFTDTVGSLFFPPAAQFEGIYYFGAVGVFLILFYAFNGTKGIYAKPMDLEANATGSHTAGRIDLWLKAFLLVWIGLISYITYGRESRLFYFLWYNMPLFSSLRVWGRMNIILVPILAWLLAFAYQYFESVLFAQNQPQATQRQPTRIRSISYLTLGFSMVLAVQLNYIRNKVFDEYWVYITPRNMFAIWEKYFKGSQRLSTLFQMLSDRYSSMSSEEILTYIGLVFVIFTLLAFFILALFVQYFQEKPVSQTRIWFVWTTLLLFSMVNMGLAGPWLWTRGVLDVGIKYRLDIEKRNLESFGEKREAGFATIISSNKFSVGIVYNWYFERYLAFLKAQEADQPALEQLLGVTDGKKLYFSERIDYPLAREFLQDAGRFQDFEKMISYTGDKLVVDVHAPAPGFLSFIDNWDADWTATVDGHPTSIALLFGTFKAVWLEPGDHQVIFEYRPFSLH